MMDGEPVVLKSGTRRRRRPPQKMDIGEPTPAPKPRRKRKASSKAKASSGVGDVSPGAASSLSLSLSASALGPSADDSVLGDRRDQMKCIALKQRALKRKYNALVYEANELMDVAERHAHTNVRLLEQRNYLLDRLVAMEEHMEKHKTPAFDYKQFLTEQVSKRRKTTAGSSPAQPPKPVTEIKKPRTRKKVEKKPVAAQKKEKITCAAMAKGRRCTGKPIADLTYCLIHAPLDADSDYVYCTYSQPDGWTCSVPVNKSIKSGLCTFHRKETGTEEPDDVSARAPVKRRRSTKKTKTKKEKKGDESMTSEQSDSEAAGIRTAEEESAVETDATADGDMEVARETATEAEEEVPTDDDDADVTGEATDSGEVEEGKDGERVEGKEEEDTDGGEDDGVRRETAAAVGGGGDGEGESGAVGSDNGGGGDESKGSKPESSADAEQEMDVEDD